MKTVTSKDGTRIAYDAVGQGPAVVLVEGALGYRASGMMPQLAELLAPHFTAISYDRRGRGESGNCPPFEVEREVEDILALIDAAGGSAHLFGASSGACLALEAALRLGRKVKQLALFEPPYDSSPDARPVWEEYCRQLDQFLSNGRRDEAVALFMRFVGAPAEFIAGARHSSGWQAMESVAPTLAYDAAAIGPDRSVPAKRAAKLAIPTLLLDGGANLEIMPFMHATAVELVQAIPGARLSTLVGQRHDVDVKVLAPVLTDFFLEAK